VRLVPGEIRELFARHTRAAGRYDVVVDLEAQTVVDDAGFRAAFSIAPYHREMLLRGLDEIGRTLLAEAHIASFERGRRNAELGTEERASDLTVPRSGEGDVA